MQTHYFSLWCRFTIDFLSIWTTGILLTNLNMVRCTFFLLILITHGKVDVSFPSPHPFTIHMLLNRYELQMMPLSIRCPCTPLLLFCISARNRLYFCRLFKFTDEFWQSSWGALDHGKTKAEEPRSSAKTCAPSSDWVSYNSFIIVLFNFALPLIDLFGTELCLEATSRIRLLELASSIQFRH